MHPVCQKRISQLSHTIGRDSRELCGENLEDISIGSCVTHLSPVCHSCHARIGGIVVEFFYNLVTFSYLNNKHCEFKQFVRESYRR